MAVKKKDTPAIKFWTPLRIVSLLIVAVLVAAIGISSCNMNGPSSNTANLPVVPSVVFDTEMRAANGNPIKLSNYSGKVLFVNLWATWCGPCRMETPELVRLHKEYQARGVALIGLTTEDPNTSAQKVRDFMTQYGVDYNIGWVTREVAVTLKDVKTRMPQRFFLTDVSMICRK